MFIELNIWMCLCVPLFSFPLHHHRQVVYSFLEIWTSEGRCIWWQVQYVTSATQYWPPVITMFRIVTILTRNNETISSNLWAQLLTCIDFTIFEISKVFLCPESVGIGWMWTNCLVMNLQKFLLRYFIIFICKRIIGTNYQLYLLNVFLKILSYLI